ncbi:hypothetical protein BOW50_12305 [Solemya velum gill symbiont]|uniref:Uncharacterized protein n=1 Tax=Solemya velum gill symbiont TaxID=2340 RepID=A0A1T2DKL2_SOVGS|nr:hypothetical protein BOV88_08565 [Solemya velum gill symbiont]OOY37448.1 hypothetical protein BOV89_06990 [Solemya velum gill symbiont]OOY43670.1 hypothetical protein BOV92_10710 [Solemya velum gill symbiont]OOY47637.1 hypothetical protein BOV93_05630 [Solemya velum gill symbiont]OOZ10582.1 hypothetical protein BOW25_13030 [Solemya velum gill symbiont]
MATHKSLSLHHKTVYQLIYADKARGGDLYRHLRVSSKSYRKRYGNYDRRGKNKNGWVSMAAQQLSIEVHALMTGRVIQPRQWVQKCTVDDGRA